MRLQHVGAQIRPAQCRRITGATPAAALTPAATPRSRPPRRLRLFAAAATGAVRPSGPRSWLRTELAGRLGITLLLIVLARAGHFVPLPGGRASDGRAGEAAACDKHLAPSAWKPGEIGCVACRHAAGVLSNAAGGQAAMELLMGRSEVAANVFVLG